MTFEEWLNHGIDKGWCGPAVCYTHDGLPCTEAEDNAWWEGFDPCVHIIRLYVDEEQRLEVEENHSPSNWRKP